MSLIGSCFEKFSVKNDFACETDEVDEKISFDFFRFFLLFRRQTICFMPESILFRSLF